MNARERMLALAVVSVVALFGGAFLFYQSFWAPRAELDLSIRALQQELDQKQARIRQIEADRLKLDRWKLLSLPGEVDLARREYAMYLSELLRQSGFAPGFIVTARPAEKSKSATPGKEPVYTRLPFTVEAHANLAKLVEMLERFYHKGLLHQIKSLAIQRAQAALPQQSSSELDIRLTIEALIVSGAELRSSLLPTVDHRLVALDLAAALQQGPTGLATALWTASPTGPLGPGILAQPPRQYAAIAKKNILLGSAPVEGLAEEWNVARHIHLTDITHNDMRGEAFLYDRSSNRTTRLRAEPGFDTFRILDDEGETLVQGKVMRLDGRDLIFQVEQNFYSMHVGENLDETLKHPLTGQQLKTLGLALLAEKGSTGQ